MEAGNAESIYNLAYYYEHGEHGLPQDRSKALELYHRAGDLGCSEAYNNIGYAYNNGEGVEVDKKKANQYYELAAMEGSVHARVNLACKEAKADLERAIKHFMIAVGGGNADSLKSIHKLYELNVATKEDYSKALKAYQEYVHEIKSDQRDKAAAANEANRYY